MASAVCWTTILYLALLQPLYCGASNNNTYYVKPKDDDRLCIKQHPCHTLNEYAKEPNQYRSSSPTFVFLPGEHVLEGEMWVVNSSNVSFVGSSSSSQLVSTKITCSNASFVFENISKVEITGIIFLYCGIDLHTNSSNKDKCIVPTRIRWPDTVGCFVPAISAFSVKQFTFTDCLVKNGYGGVFVEYSSMLLSNSVFEHNYADSGAGVFALASSLQFEGETAFVRNVAKLRGGGIYTKESNLTFHGYNVFSNNTARHRAGGAIYSRSGSILDFHGNTSIVNCSSVGGGGIYMWNSVLICIGTIKFTNNSAHYFGGGIFAIGGTLIFNGNNSFAHNLGRSGGGIYAWSVSLLTFDGHTSFTSNTAGRFGGGGGVRVHSRFRWQSKFIASIITFKGYIDFVNNSALGNDGGGISALQDNTLNFVGITKFEHNSAITIGGGIAAYQRCNLTFNGVTKFGHNSAQYGGGIFVAERSHLTLEGDSTFLHNSALRLGGGILTGNPFIINGGATLYAMGKISFTNNTVGLQGGGLFGWLGSVLYFEGDSTFLQNSAGVRGGGVRLTGCILSTNGAITFEHNSAVENGGGVFASMGNLSFSGHSTFKYNSANTGGGILSDQCTLTFEGHNIFVHNSATKEDGGGINLRLGNNSLSFHGNTKFKNCSAQQYGGGIVAWSNATLSFYGNSSFTGNSAFGGGGISSENSMLRFEGNGMFADNSASEVGGAIYGSRLFIFNGNIEFIHNIAYSRHGTPSSGGGIHSPGSSIIFNRNSRFTDNAAYFGGAISTIGTEIKFNGKGTFINNSGQYGGAIYLQKSHLRLKGTNSFVRNSANHYSGYGGGILMRNSKLTFSGYQKLINNTASYGGGIALTGLDSDQSTLYPYGTMVFTGNHARQYGGALSVEDNPFKYCLFDQSSQHRLREACFFQFLHQECQPLYTIHVNSSFIAARIVGFELIFEENYAQLSGNDVYGGNLDTCGVCGYPKNKYRFVNGGITFNILAHTSAKKNPTTQISSKPFRVCSCHEDQPDCSKSVIALEAFPGETITLSLATVGQRNGTLPGIIRSDFIKPNAIQLGHLQNAQSTTQTCTLLQYTLFSINTAGNLSLFSEGPCSVLGLPLELVVKFHSCPSGFSLSNAGTCDCEERLQIYTRQCNINDQTIQNNGDFWMGYDNKTEGLILSPHCPFDYCNSGLYNVTLNNTNVQCNHNRSGILCGGCKPGHSIVFGTSQCLPCTNSYISLLALFAFAGIILVAVLFTCKLTVAAGTLSGLIFYANMVGANRNIFFPPGEESVLTVFIAWLNLDIGIQTCFFEGMDAYSKTWLQFAFPVYIWLLVLLIAVSSHYSSTVAKLIGSTNPVSILVTLFLLSYTKLLRTIIAAFSFTTLEYQNDNTQVVWLYDGSVAYLAGKHIALFLISLVVFLVLFVPYTLILLLGQWIQARTNCGCVSRSCYLRMNFFLDAYHAPYKNHHRYWSGLLLVFRFLLYLISVVVSQNPAVNLLAISVCIAGLQVWAWNIHGVYKKRHLDALESSFFLNLVILCIATYQVKVAGGNQAAVAYTSVSVAFITFIAIVTVHFYQQVINTRIWRLYLHPKLHFTRKLTQQYVRFQDEVQLAETPTPNPLPTTTHINIHVREPLDLLTS